MFFNFYSYQLILVDCAHLFFLMGPMLVVGIYEWRRGGFNISYEPQTHAPELTQEPFIPHAA